MGDSQMDYRLIQKMESGVLPVYFVGEASRTDFDELFVELVGNGPSVKPQALQTQGRLVQIPRGSLARGVARFTFADLCQKALGAADYLVIGHHFHTVFVEDIPVLTLDELNWVRRFITFVDAMYESHVKLILHSHVPMEGIFQPASQTEHDEVFAFDRTLSRLDEMSSGTYLRNRWATKARTSTSKAALGSNSDETVVAMEQS
jgi:predicted ATPase